MSCVVNWPLFWSDKKPMWWYIDKWTSMKSRIDPASIWQNFGTRNWIFWVDAQWIPHMYPYADIPKNQHITFQWAFQNWPILVQNGTNVCWSSTTEYIRSWLWFTKDWKIKIIISNEPITFSWFANLFVQQWCTDAMYLDWWPTAWLITKQWLEWQLDPEAQKLQFFH